MTAVEWCLVATDDVAATVDMTKQRPQTAASA